MILEVWKGVNCALWVYGVEYSWKQVEVRLLEIICQN